MLLKSVKEGSWIALWIVVEHMEEIKILLERCNARLSHILREDNKLVDHLVNHALDIGP